MATEKAPVSSVENSVLARSVIIACVILTAIFIALLFFQNNLARFFGQYADEATIGLMLMALWLVVSSTIRSLNNLVKGMETWKLLLGGLLIGLLSSLLTTAYLIVFPDVAKSQNTSEVTGATGGLILVISAIAFIISMISVINMRVRSRTLGNILELLIIGGAIAGLVWFATK
ncbi:MAG: hypothetical protein IPM82_13525 [Saprospiraceae bacterium]|nr:hypothetical protein [Saprospiraceae bacterium]